VANTRSARKRIRANERKHVRNRGVRSAVRTKVSKARRALLNPVEGVEVASAVRDALSALDRAAAKGVLHGNNARRRKSRLASMAASLLRAGQEGAGEVAAARSTAAGGAKGRSTKPAAAKSGGKPGTRSTGQPARAKAPAPKSSAAQTPAAKSTTARSPRGGRTSTKR
jgi:small subunit ribosomal protein S20